MTLNYFEKWFHSMIIYMLKIYALEADECDIILKKLEIYINLMIESF